MSTTSTNRFKQVVEWIVNICIICVSCTLIFFCFSYFRDRSTSPKLDSRNSQYGLTKGELLNIGQIRQRNPEGRLLLIALQSGCRFCKESIPLYRSLVQHPEALNAKVVFIFAESIPTALKYFQENEIKAENIAHADFSSLNVTGTPTMILIDPQNKIVDFWIGKIEGDRLPAFYKELGIQR